MTLTHILSFLCIAASAVASGQEPSVQLDSTDVPGGRIVRTERYDGTSLWGYIDGGADIYLEYGFDQLTAQVIELNGHRFTVDAYRMKDAEAAFGIFSIKRHKCLSDSLAALSCVSRYQVQVAQGNFYISIANENGTTGEQQMAVSLAQRLLQRIDGEPFQPPDEFRGSVFLPYLRELKLVRGALGLQNEIPRWEEWFHGVDDFSIYHLPVENDSCDFLVSLISFDSVDDAARFYRNVGLDPNDLEIRKLETGGERTKYFVPVTRTRANIIESRRISKSWWRAIDRISSSK